METGLFSTIKFQITIKRLILLDTNETNVSESFIFRIINLKSKSAMMSVSNVRFYENVFVSS